MCIQSEMMTLTLFFFFQLFYRIKSGEAVYGPCSVCGWVLGEALGSGEAWGDGGWGCRGLGVVEQSLGGQGLEAR